MQYRPVDLEFHPFDPEDSLPDLPDSRQTKYLRKYLADLDTETIVVEPHYFDRDYLEEFSAFYGKNVRGYKNACRRLHFFGAAFDREFFESAVAERDEASATVRDSYHGFVVHRPIPSAPVGRTVLAWYPERNDNRPRIREPRRRYTAHLAGLELEVEGLAWQQQDKAVSRCSTCALWSMLHSSAYDERYTVPTTTDIRRAAHQTAAAGDRLFPSVGMTPSQMSEAIKQLGLQPMMMDGDIPSDSDEPFGFEPVRFASLAASLIRSGYPALLGGELRDEHGNGHHATCLVGVREPKSVTVLPKECDFQDRSLEYLYVHDDNIGPQVRFELRTGTEGEALLAPSKPPQADESDGLLSLDIGQYEFRPTEILTAVHDDIRLAFDDLHKMLLRIGTEVSARFSEGMGGAPAGFSGSMRIFRLADYVTKELGRLFGHDDPDRLAAARLGIWEKLPPMSLHIGVIRLGLASTESGAGPWLDILVDTTELRRNDPIFGCLLFEGVMNQVVPTLEIELGVCIDVS